MPISQFISSVIVSTVATFLIVAEKILDDFIGE